MSFVIARRNGNPLVNARRLADVIDQAFGAWPFSGELAPVSSAWMPATDVVEDKDGLKIVVELPGLRPEDVKLTLENHALTIRGQKQHVTEEKDARLHRYERSYGSFERAFSLPDTVDSERISANFENGLLTITLPKSERAKPREIAVK